MKDAPNTGRLFAVRLGVPVIRPKLDDAIVLAQGTSKSWLTCCNVFHTAKLCQYAVTKFTRGKKIYIFYSNSTLSTFSTQGIWLLTLSVSQYVIVDYAPNKSFEDRTRKSIAFRCCTPVIFYVFSLLFATVRVDVLACANARPVFLFLPYYCPEGLYCVIYQARCSIPNYREMRSKVANAYNNFKRYYRYGD